MRHRLFRFLLPILSVSLCASASVVGQACPATVSDPAQQDEAERLFLDATFYLKRLGRSTKADPVYCKSALLRLDEAGTKWPGVGASVDDLRYHPTDEGTVAYEPFFQAGMCRQVLGEFDEALRNFALGECREVLGETTLKELRTRREDCKNNVRESGTSLFIDGLDDLSHSWEEAALRFWLAEQVDSNIRKLNPNLRGGRWRDKKVEWYLPRFYLGVALVDGPCQQAARNALETARQGTEAIESETFEKQTLVDLLDKLEDEQPAKAESRCWQWCCWSRGP